MMDIALHDHVGPVTLADISQCQGISLSYLEQLFAKLRRGKLVEGVRGPGGGYRLARPANQISVAEIIDAVDEKLDMTRCGGDADCDHGERCLTHQLWMELSEQLYDFLDSITLDQFVNRPQVRELVTQQDAKFGRFLNKRSAA
jgi:Rrf2 family iron-sulfur cluster assembly transcriptional regulator